ncbi:hypothetical protein F5Y00DRAFT_261123 [Daldinia vernicosa]|uniref:uncharacterized protein n=1 Tax=Daldinia vernicosa TaxID=114800 RepID=UPI0020081E40|nr:uncharacterized protein F5Y00DRAFT_261123 [Daldinia vernicosa]KAI0850020.1 hypothetical protein F5Y00DRAFT_261123 [Daldinia vernicosa]
MSGTVRINYPFTKVEHLSNNPTRPLENAALLARARVKKSGSYPDETVHTAELTLPESNNLKHGPTAELCSAQRPSQYHFSIPFSACSLEHNESILTLSLSTAWAIEFTKI